MVADIQRRQRDEEARKEREAEAATRRWAEEGSPLHEAEAELRKAIDDFFHVVVPEGIRLRDTQTELAAGIFAGKTTDDLWHVPAQVGIKVDAGTGKTHRTIEMMVATLPSGRRYGFAIGTHLKAEEIELLANQLAGREVAAIWRGIDRPDPNAPGEKMCRRAEAVNELRKVGRSRTELCGSPKRGFCPFHNTCGYRAQEQQQPAIWIVPHSLLAHEPPKAMKDVDALIIDEARGIEPHTSKLMIADFTANRKHKPDAVQRVEQALRDTKPGEYLSRDTLLMAGVTRRLCEVA
jgi:hypothetical protein